MAEIKELPSVLEQLVNEYAEPTRCVMTLEIKTSGGVTSTSFTHIDDYIKLHIRTVDINGVVVIDDEQYIKPEIIYDLICNEIDDSITVSTGYDWMIYHARKSYWLYQTPSRLQGNRSVTLQTSEECEWFHNVVRRDTPPSIDSLKVEYCCKLFSNLYM